MNPSTNKAIRPSENGYAFAGLARRPEFGSFPAMAVADRPGGRLCGPDVLGRGAGAGDARVL